MRQLSRKIIKIFRRGFLRWSAGHQTKEGAEERGISHLCQNSSSRFHLGSVTNQRHISHFHFLSQPAVIIMLQFVSATEMPLQCRKFTCPLTNTIMQDPVIVPCCGANFDRKAILNWMRKNGNRCPQSGEDITPLDLKTNTKLQWKIMYLERTYSDKNDFIPERFVSCSSTNKVSPSRPNSRVDSPPVLPKSPRPGASSRKTHTPRVTDILDTTTTTSTTTSSQSPHLFNTTSTCSVTTSSCEVQTKEVLPSTQPPLSTSFDTLSFESMRHVDSAPTAPRRSDGGMSIHEARRMGHRRGCRRTGMT